MRSWRNQNGGKDSGKHPGINNLRGSNRWNRLLRNPVRLNWN